MFAWLESLGTRQGIVDSLLAAILFAFAVGGIRQFGLWLWIWRDKLRFSLDGTYVGVFEDEELCSETGHRLRKLRSGLAKLAQRGSNVKIIHSIGKNKSWTLRGELVDRRHLAGIYEADDEFDTGVGSFYLLVKGDRMTGVWTGYDHENSKVSTGEYEFRKVVPMRPPFRADKRHLAEIQTVAVDVFGPGYFKDIQDELQEGELRFVLGIRQKLPRGADSPIVGFAAGYLLASSELAGLLGIPVTELPRNLASADANGTVGVLKSIAVKRDLQGRGVGYTLFEAAENQLKRLGATCVVIPAWKSPAGYNLHGILKRQDYKEFLVKPDYWKSACDKKDFSCPERSEHCVCHAVFWSKVLGTGKDVA